jgi:hypothetical protein
LARRVVALAIRAMEVVARPVALLAVLVGPVLERLALRAGAAQIRLAVRAWRTRALRAGVLRVAALGLAGSALPVPLLAVVMLAVVA